MRLQITMLALMTLVSLVISASVSSSQPQGFERRVASYEDEEDYDGQAQTHVGYRSRLYDYSNEQEEEQEPPQRTSPGYSRSTPQQQKQQIYPKKVKSISSEELEEEEEPDRLALFLEKSKFGCDGKVTGYYADDTVNCEVFHYCQDNQRHSWVCPEGFTFHQVHLICMPPSNDNICEQSQKYHVVNNYLYKPINLEEHQSKPNVSLRYSERYFPEDIYEDQRYQYESRQDRIQQHHHQRQPVQVGFQHQQVQQVQQPQRVTQPARQHNIVQQQQYQTRKATIPQPTQQIHTSPIPYTQTIITPAPSPQPTPYRFATQVTNHPQQHQTHQQVFRSPEEINISLQQRRPQIFIATSTPRYYEDEYSYERRK